MRIYRNRMLSMGMVRGDVIASKSALSGYKEQGFKELKGICAYHITGLREVNKIANI